LMIAQLRIFAWKVWDFEPDGFCMPEFLEAHVKHEKSGVPLPAEKQDDPSKICTAATRCTCGGVHHRAHNLGGISRMTMPSPDQMSFPNRASRRSKFFNNKDGALPGKFVKNKGASGNNWGGRWVPRAI
jgi:hypothetical protein